MVDRINILLKAKNITARQFAEEIGIQPSGMSHILSGRNNPSLDFVLKVMKRWPEVNINWLMFGKGEMLQADQVAEGSQPEVTSAHAEVSQRFERESNIGGMQATLFAPYDDQRRRNENPAKANPSDDGKKTDKRQRYITEIRVFYSDGTFESFASNKQP